MSRFAGILYPPGHAPRKELESMLACQMPQKKCFLFQSQNFIFGGPSLYVQDQKWALALDGEIENIHELQEDLERSGQRLQGEGPLAILLLAYQAYGFEFAKRLKGAFSFALFDQTLKKFFLVRDPLGQKPLYWAQRGEYLLFSSELKGLLASNLILKEPSVNTLGTFLFYGFFPKDLTPIKGVSKLLPGYYLQSDLEHRFSQKPFSSLGSFLKSRETLPEEEALRALQPLLHKIEKQSLLSLQEPTPTLTPQEFIHFLPQALWHLEEPTSSPLFVSLWKRGLELTGENKILTSDIGIRELLGRGILPYQASLINRFLDLFSPFFYNLYLPLKIKADPEKGYSLLREFSTSSPLLNYLKQKGVFNGSDLGKIAPSLNISFQPELFLHKYYSPMTPIEESFYNMEITTFLIDQSLVPYERVADALRIPLKTPFLDFDLFFFLLKLPLAMKKKWGHFPSEPPPFYGTWSKEAILSPLFEALPQGVLVELGFLSKKGIQEALSKKDPSQVPKWIAILTLDLWFRLFLTRSNLEEPKESALFYLQS